MANQIGPIVHLERPTTWHKLYHARATRLSLHLVLCPVIKLLSKSYRISNLLLEGGLSHEQQSEAARRGRLNPLHLIITLSLTLNFIQVSKCKKKKQKVHSITCGHRHPF